MIRNTRNSIHHKMKNMAMRQPTNKATRTEEEHSPSCPEVRITSDRTTLELFAEDAFAMVQNEFLYYDYRSFENIRKSSTFHKGYSQISNDDELAQNVEGMIDRMEKGEHGFLFYIFNEQRIKDDSAEFIKYFCSLPSSSSIVRVVCYSSFVQPGTCSINLLIIRDMDPGETHISPEYFWRYRPSHYGSKFITNRTGEEQTAHTFYKENHPLDFSIRYSDDADSNLQRLAGDLYSTSDNVARLALLYLIASVLEGPERLDFALVYKTVVGVADPIVRGLKPIYEPSEMTALYFRYYCVLERRKREQPGYSMRCKEDFISIYKLYDDENNTSFYSALVNWISHWNKYGNDTNRREVLDILDRLLFSHSLFTADGSLEEAVRELISTGNPEVLYPEVILARMNYHIQ